MDSTKIRMKIGDHEFEAEGPPEAVQAQFEVFRELIRNAAIASPQSQPPNNIQDAVDKAVANKVAHVTLEKIMRITGRVISLTAIPPSVEDAALLIMLGHKDFRDNENVTGQEIGDGLAQSGRPVPRTDRIMDRPIASSLVLKSGVKRSTRYRLTNTGHQRALDVARELIASLPS